VYLTGEPAEELVENLPGISETVMETHEEIALVATVVVGAFALVALYGLFAFRHGVSMGFTKLLLVLSLLPLATMAYTAYLGGQIRHSEIRPDAVGAPSAGGPAGAVRGGMRTRILALGAGFALAVALPSGPTGPSTGLALGEEEVTYPAAIIVGRYVQSCRNQ